MSKRNNEQRIFIRDARFTWKTILTDPNKHISNGVTRYDYLESLGARMGGQARCLLNNSVDKWGHKGKSNPIYEEAVTREASQAMWRIYYKAKVVFDLR